MELRGLPIWCGPHRRAGCGSHQSSDSRHQRGSCPPAASPYRWISPARTEGHSKERTVELRLTEMEELPVGPSTPTPAESYPRYSSLCRPLISRSRISFLVLGVKWFKQANIPHMVGQFLKSAKQNESVENRGIRIISKTCLLYTWKFGINN